MLVNSLQRYSRVGLFLLLTSILVANPGCNGSSKTASHSISGRIERNGKPVFPVVLMLQDQTGKSLTANIKSQDGSFSIFGVELGKKYSVAIEPIQLAGISPAARAEAAQRAEQAKAEGRELRREDTIPSQFQNANIDFPSKYKSFNDSGLVIDCTTEVPPEPVILNLE